MRIYVRQRAAGKCEGCGKPAPFLTPAKQPYLEPHHIRRRLRVQQSYHLRAAW